MCIPKVQGFAIALDLRGAYHEIWMWATLLQPGIGISGAFFVCERIEKGRLIRNTAYKENCMIWLALALLYAVCMATVRLSLRLDINRTPTLHITAMIWRLRLVYDAALERKAEGYTLSIRRHAQRSKPKPPAESTLQDAKKASAFVRSRPRTRAYLRTHVHLHSLRWAVRIGTQDAEWTALLCGLFSFFSQLLSSRLRGEVQTKFSVCADYRRAAFLCSADCIITFRIGHIIGVGLLAVLEGCKTRVEEKHAQASA